MCKGYKLYKVPNNQTASCQCNITKIAKQILINYYCCIEEVGIRDFGQLKGVADLYDLETKTAFELIWANNNINEIIRKLELYKLFSKSVYCVLLKDSKNIYKDKQYTYLLPKLLHKGYKIMVLDISSEIPILQLN